jgi:hypothetical protein
VTRSDFSIHKGFLIKEQGDKAEIPAFSLDKPESGEIDSGPGEDILTLPIAFQEGI